jgi:16S rRNA (cytosine1407-C5)-methyltransferase
MTPLPALFVTRLTQIFPPQQIDAVLRSFSSQAASGIRVNTLKMSISDGGHYLRSLGILGAAHPAVDTLFIVSAEDRERVHLDPAFSDGRLYWQSPSSTLPATILAPAANERVLDMCAAPGSKTTQMAAIMENTGEITAVEAVKNRFYKLKSVCTLTGSANVRCILTDARRFRCSEPLYDKVLVDAPCSSEGRFNTADKDSFGYWSPRKIKEMAHKQKGILLNAARCLKPGGTLVYSTCTFAPEENETVVDWFLRKTKGSLSLQPFDLPEVACYPALTQFENRAYSHDLSNCRRILPGGIFSGFFIAKFIKS